MAKKFKVGSPPLFKRVVSGRNGEIFKAFGRLEKGQALRIPIMPEEGDGERMRNSIRELLIRHGFSPRSSIDRETGTLILWEPETEEVQG